MDDGCLSDRRREGLAPGPLPPGHRLGVRRRQALQTPRLGRRAHRAHLPGHTLPDTPRRRRKTNSKEDDIMSKRSARTRQVAVY